MSASRTARWCGQSGASRACQACSVRSASRWTVAPGCTESALAANSMAFNLGVAAGALLGGAVLPVVGLRGAFLVGGLLTLGALAVLGLPERGWTARIGRYWTGARV
jgi:predicted MFS family arabinose efflux permease